MKKIYEAIKRERAYKHAMSLLSWDLETAATKDSIEGISETMGVLAELQYLNFINDEFKKELYSLDIDKLNEIEKKIVKVIKEEKFEKLSKIPVEEFSKFEALISKASSAWEIAKKENRYELFKDYLKEIFETTKKFIKYRGYKGHPYSVLLDDFEKGLDVETCDKFFDEIRKELVPFALKVLKKNNSKIEKIKNKLKEIPVEKQKLMSNSLIKLVDFNRDRGYLAESEHPFTTFFNNKDVRFTTHYYKDDILSNIYSVIHELGHAIYEQQVDDEFDKTTILAGGSTMGMHEAQSRFYENLIGKNKAFMKSLSKRIKELYEIDLSEEELYLLVNEVKRQFIRIEADELTYPIHVMIRYEIEKEIFENLDTEVDVDKLPDKWNDLYEKYLGIRPNTYSLGILQDSHWSGAAIGYFPAYAIGSAYASQIYAAMNKNFDVESAIREENIKEINKFLKEKIHRYGFSKEPKELLQLACKEDFNPTYYINYLKNKFLEIYGGLDE